MERLLQALDELDDLVTALRHLWLLYGPPPQPRPRRASPAGAAGRALALPDAAAAGG